MPIHIQRAAHIHCTVMQSRRTNIMDLWKGHLSPEVQAVMERARTLRTSPSSRGAASHYPRSAVTSLLGQPPVVSDQSTSPSTVQVRPDNLFVGHDLNAINEDEGNVCGNAL